MVARGPDEHDGPKLADPPVNDRRGTSVQTLVRFRLLKLPWLLGLACAASAVCGRGQPEEPAAMSSVEVTERGERVALRAAGLVGTSLRRYPVSDDCSGLVRLAYQSVGVELLSQGRRPGENAASAMYRRAMRAGALHRHTPEPGDIVFFRETYDRNRDGLRNDGVTHVGVIESVASDGSVVFVHRGGKGVVRARMNLSHPERKGPGGEILNDYIRKAEGGKRARLTSELFAGYASASRL
ncbi:CHAP domain-containing protein [Cystobacter fuscus]|uniref:CHAP domain-containing protein n=1 Tax=Cystobacter fuscus TaxID=43 RepID=UPI0037BED37A